MFEISFPLNIKFSIEGESHIVNISEKIREIEIEKQILKKIINQYNETITTELCGEKYKHDKKERRYERAGTSSRTITTLSGEIWF